MNTVLVIALTMVALAYAVTIPIAREHLLDRDAEGDGWLDIARGEANGARVWLVAAAWPAAVVAFLLFAMRTERSDNERESSNPRAERSRQAARAHRHLRGS